MGAVGNVELQIIKVVPRIHSYDNHFLWDLLARYYVKLCIYKRLVISARVYIKILAEELLRSTTLLCVWNEKWFLLELESFKSFKLLG